MRARRGEVVTFFTSVLKRTDKNCIIWPFGQKGVINKRRPQMRLNGKQLNVAREILLKTQGASPSKNNHAAHSCGNGLCVNPTHLYWASPAQNEADKRKHGTHIQGEDRWNSKLTEKDVIEIRNSKESSIHLGKRYGVSRQTIDSARSYRSWQWLK